MTNSQQEFEKWFYEQGFGHDSEGHMEMAWQACDSRWRAKLDEGKIVGVLQKARWESSYDIMAGKKRATTKEIDSAIAKAIIEYLTKEEK